MRLVVITLWCLRPELFWDSNVFYYTRNAASAVFGTDATFASHIIDHITGPLLLGRIPVPPDIQIHVSVKDIYSIKVIH